MSSHADSVFFMISVEAGIDSHGLYKELEKRKLELKIDDIFAPFGKYDFIVRVHVRDGEEALHVARELKSMPGICVEKKYLCTTLLGPGTKYIDDHDSQ